jgi:cell division protein FtsB
MRGARLSAPDARDYERIKAENQKITADNQRLSDQNEQANAEIARLTSIIRDFEARISTQKIEK